MMYDTKGDDKKKVFIGEKYIVHGDGTVEFVKKEEKPKNDK